MLWPSLLLVMGRVVQCIIKFVTVGKAVDMWALGCLAFSLVEGFPPFRKTDFVYNICSGNYEFNPSYWEHVSSDARDFISRLLEIDITKRMNVGEAMEHAWMTCDDSTLRKKNLDNNLNELKKYNAAQRFKRGVFAVIAANRFRIQEAPCSATISSSADINDIGTMQAELADGLDDVQEPVPEDEAQVSPEMNPHIQFELNHADIETGISSTMNETMIAFKSVTDFFEKFNTPSGICPDIIDTDM